MQLSCGCADKRDNPSHRPIGLMSSSFGSPNNANTDTMITTTNRQQKNKHTKRSNKQEATEKINSEQKHQHHKQRQKRNTRNTQEINNKQTNKPSNNVVAVV